MRCILQKPGSATLPFFGVVPAVVDEKGNELEGACEGYLCIKQVPSLHESSCNSCIDAGARASCASSRCLADEVVCGVDGGMWVCGRDCND